MAKKEVNTKATDKVEEVKKIEEVEEIKEPVEIKEETQNNEEVDILKQQIEEMKKAMAELMASKAEIPSSKVVIKKEEDEVVIGCRVLQGIGWGSPEDAAGEIRLSYNEEQVVTVSDMKRFFRQAAIRKLFEDGLCYFAEPENYVLFNIRKHIDLSDENLIKILDKKDANEIIRDLNKLTNEQKNSSIINCIIFRISSMIKEKKLVWEYFTQASIEKYFGIEFERCIRTLQAVKSLRN